MDEERFDTLTRMLLSARTRRAAVGGLLAGSLGVLDRTAAVARKKGHAAAQKRDRHHGAATAEACIPTGKQCPAKKPRGKKTGRVLSCNDCCQGIVIQVTGRKGKLITKCSCRSPGTACNSSNAAECCGGAASCQGGVCGGPPPAAVVATCGAANCRGCCDGTTCREGDTENTCGRGGVACAACAAGSTCEAGACATATCGPDTCSGCCDGTTCRAGETSNFCGRDGESCDACSALEVCAGGSCACQRECCEDFHCRLAPASRCTRLGTCEACVPDRTSPGSSCLNPVVPCCTGSCIGINGVAYCGGCLPTGANPGSPNNCSLCCNDQCNASGTLCA